MIDKNDHLRQTGVYLHEGKLWRIMAYFSGPSIEMHVIGDKKQTKSFGIGSLIDSYFHKIDALNVNDDLTTFIKNE